jgi:flagellar biosynthesis protein FliQ
MNDTDILHLGAEAIIMIGKLSAPVLIVSLAVGIVVSLVQTVLSLQDQTLSMVPRLALTAGVLLVTGGWMLNTMVDYTTNLFNSIPDLIK